MLALRGKDLRRDLALEMARLASHLYDAGSSNTLYITLHSESDHVCLVARRQDLISGAEFRRPNSTRSRNRSCRKTASFAFAIFLLKLEACFIL